MASETLHMKITVIKNGGNNMYYVTVKQSPKYHQMTLEELLFSTDIETSGSLLNPNTTNTRTYEVERITHRVSETVDISALISKLEAFNEQTDFLRDKPRRELYNEFYIPKKSGGLRKIDAPEPELMNALRQLKVIFEEDFRALYHTCAFAYIKQRSTLDAVKRHQSNESKWFSKYDLSNFLVALRLSL